MKRQIVDEWEKKEDNKTINEFKGMLMYNFNPQKLIPLFKIAHNETKYCHKIHTIS
jgi:hypothetical protein